jgi:hypothetical protein
VLLAWPPPEELVAQALKKAGYEHDEGAVKRVRDNIMDWAGKLNSSGEPAKHKAVGNFWVAKKTGLVGEL